MPNNYTNFYFNSLREYFCSIKKRISKEELAKINRELDNPLAKRWSLVFQEKFSVNQGDVLEKKINSNTFFFQPALPIPFGRNMVFTARAVFPLVTQPNFSADPTGNVLKQALEIFRWLRLCGLVKLPD